MINKLRFGAAGAVLAAALSMGSVAHAADTATADATAEILSSLTLDVQAGTTLDFGQMVLGGSADTVVLDSANSLTCGGTIVCSGTTGVPTFNITTGTPLKDVTVNLPASTTLVRQLSGGATAQDVIELDTFTSSAATVTLDNFGAGSFTVGGTIHVDGDETAGIFDGTFDVSVEYA